MSDVLCPHCQALNRVTDRFCIQCGKALPTIDPTGPTISSGKEVGVTAVGQELQSEALQKKIKTASGALLAVAIIQTLTILVFYFLLRGAPAQAMVVAILSVIASVFWGLWWWSRSSPFPAAVTGLVIFVTLHLADAAMDPAALFRGIIIKLIILYVLIRAVLAGLEHRKIKEEMAQTIG